MLIGILNYAGAYYTSEENKDELKNQYDENVRNTDELHKRYNATIRETYELNKRDLSSQYEDNTHRMNMLYKNYGSDLKEAYGVMSQRTIDEFIAEKVPRDMSFDQANSLIEKALSKWITTG